MKRSRKRDKKRKRGKNSPAAQEAEATTGATKKAKTKAKPPKKTKAKAKRRERLPIPSRRMVRTMERFLQMIMTMDSVAVEREEIHPFCSVDQIRQLFSLYVRLSDLTPEDGQHDICRYIKKETFPMMGGLIRRERFRGYRFEKAFGYDATGSGKSNQVIHGMEIKYPGYWASHVAAAQYAFEHTFVFGFDKSYARFAVFVEEAKKLKLQFAEDPRVQRNPTMTTAQQSTENLVEFQKRFVRMNQGLAFIVADHIQKTLHSESDSSDSSEGIEGSESDDDNARVAPRRALSPPLTLRCAAMRENIDDSSSECELDDAVSDSAIGATTIGSMEPADDYDILFVKVGKMLRRKKRNKIRQLRKDQAVLVTTLVKATEIVGELSSSSDG